MRHLAARETGRSDLLAQCQGFADFAVRNDTAKIVTAYAVEATWPGMSLPPSETKVDIWGEMPVWPHAAQPGKFGPGESRVVLFGIQNGVRPVVRVTTVIFSDQTWEGDARIAREIPDDRRGALAGLMEVVKSLEAANRGMPDNSREALRVAADHIRKIAPALRP